MEQGINPITILWNKNWKVNIQCEENLQCGENIHSFTKEHGNSCEIENNKNRSRESSMRFVV